MLMKYKVTKNHPISFVIVSNRLVCVCVKKLICRFMYHQTV